MRVRQFAIACIVATIVFDVAFSVPRALSNDKETFVPLQSLAYDNEGAPMS